MEKKVEENTDHSYFNTEMIGDLLGDQLRQDSNVVPRLESLEQKMERLKMTEENEDVEILYVDDDEGQKEISSIVWGIFILSFFSQILTAGMFLLTNPIATWQAALVMVIMAAQNTIIGGALKMLTKKLDFTQKKYSREKESNTKSKFEKTNLEERIKMLESENTRINVNLDDSHAEILKLKKELYNKL